MTLSKSFPLFGLLFAGIVIGVFLCNYSYFTFEKEINFFDLFSLALTSALGIYITVIIGRVFNKENSEKQLLIEEVRESAKIINEISVIVSSNSYSLGDVSVKLKLVNENLHLLKSLLEASHCKSVLTESVRTELQKFRRHVSNGTVNNNQVTLSFAQQQLAKKSAVTLKKLYYELIFSINGC